MTDNMLNVLAAALQTLPGFLAILNVAILLFAVFFFTSTLASHLLEYFVGGINSRGRQLEERLKAALGEPAAAAVYANPLIASLCAEGRDGAKLPPSYIEPNFLARAIVAEFAKAGAVSASGIVQQLKAEAGEDAAAFRNGIVEWFGAVNQRQNGVYTRWSFMRLFVIGFLMAAVLDIDTVHIAGTLWGKPELAEKLVGDLERAVPAASGDLSQLSDADRQKLNEAVDAAWQAIRAEAATPPLYAWQSGPGSAVAWAAKLIGWLLTALATSLGAQFWFNLRSESLKLRAAGRKPDAAAPAAPAAPGDPTPAAPGPGE
jgi:hypothetical protein